MNGANRRGLALGAFLALLLPAPALGATAAQLATALLEGSGVTPLNATLAAANAEQQAIVETSRGLLQPVVGDSFILLSTGDASAVPATQNHLDPGNERGTDVAGGSDRATLTLRLRVPDDRNSVQLYFQFLTTEAPEFIGEGYNDAFTAMVESPAFGTYQLAVDQNSQPISVDAANYTLAGRPLGGTGFELYAVDPDDPTVGVSPYPTPSEYFNVVTQTAPTSGVDDATDAGATDLYRAVGPVAPGETITLTLHIFDNGDQWADSMAFVDGLAFLSETTEPPAVGEVVLSLRGSTFVCVDVDGGNFEPGDTLQCTVTVTNSSTAAAGDISVVVPLAAGVSNLSVGSVPDGATDTSTADTVTVSGFAVGAQESVEIVFTVTLDGPVGPGTVISHTATVTSSDPNVLGTVITTSNTADCTDCDGDGDPDLSDCAPLDPYVFTGAPEICDGIDNNCVAGIDEGFDVGLPCDGPDSDLCENGTWRCSRDGLAAECDNETVTDLTEICNAADDDCDGATDEDFADLGTACDGPDGDLCTNGTIVCTADGAGVECGPEEPENLVDVCNGLDDDCDGVTDEDFPELGAACDGVDDDLCPNGTWTCAADGAAVECTNEDPAGLAELCNAIDDDCDGLTDEDFPGRGAPCDGADADWCANGTATCTADGTDLECVNEDPADIEEVCNGADDNCDMHIDEGFADTDGDLTADCIDDDDDDDGLSDAAEAEWETDPTDPDSDDDGIADGLEVDTSNADGVPQTADDFATDPTNPDTDGDGIFDGLELDTSNADGQRDTADDFWTDPTNPDTDGDDVADGLELDTSNVDGVPGTADDFWTDPTNPDTDGDLWNDGVELACASDPTNPESLPADLDGDGTADCADDCVDQDGDGYGHERGCLGSDCDDTVATCTTDCSDADLDGTADCAETCSDGDGDGYGSGACLGPDCDDTNADCNVDCSDTDLDGTADCMDDCVDRDGDGYGAERGCLGPDCDDGYATCAADCSDADANGTPDCAENCTDGDGDGYGTGSSCLGADCDDAVATCTSDCSDADQDGTADCADDCVDQDGDGYGSGAACTAADCDDAVATCTTDCADADEDGTADCAVVPCTGDADCASGLHCDAATGVCVECVADADCTNGVCNETTQTCDPWDCVSDADCTSGTCDPTHHVCLTPDCTSDADCSATAYCDAGTCATFPCAADRACPGEYAVCELAAGKQGGFCVGDGLSTEGGPDTCAAGGGAGGLGPAALILLGLGLAFGLRRRPALARRID